MAGALFEHPYYPIIYVRGYAGTDSDIEDTVSDPYMGFNLGPTRIRTLWTGDTERYYFESPLVRLMKDFKYSDVYSAGLNITEIDKVPPGTIDPRSITIYRYYDQVSSVFGPGKQVAMEDFGRGLSDLIIKLRDRICVDDTDKAGFKVYLVGHSMGGLVIRCFLQNDKIGDPIARKYVDKVFTYATPHNGIELEIIGNVPSFFTAQSANNFNRERMCSYLGLPAGTEKVNTLNGKFDIDRFFVSSAATPRITPSPPVGRRGSSVRLVMGSSAPTMRPYSIVTETPARQSLRHAPSSIAAIRDITESSIPKRVIKT